MATRKKFDDIHVNKRSYRGTTTVTVCWNENGFPDQRDFDSEEAAAEFVRKLRGEVVELANSGEDAAPAAAAESWVEPMKVYLSLLQTTPEQLNQFLGKLTKSTKRPFAEWVTHVEQCIGTRATINEFAGNQKLSVDDYLSKLSSFEEEPLDEILNAYDRYNFSRKETRRLLSEYIGVCQSEEDDEDEVQFAKIKLERMLNAFRFDVFSVDDNQVEGWLAGQKGSEAAKQRLLDIINNFRTYADRNKSEVPVAFTE